MKTVNTVIVNHPGNVIFYIDENDKIQSTTLGSLVDDHIGDVDPDAANVYAIRSADGTFEIYHRRHPEIVAKYFDTLDEAEAALPDWQAYAAEDVFEANLKWVGEQPDFPFWFDSEAEAQEFLKQQQAEALEDNA